MPSDTLPLASARPILEDLSRPVYVSRGHDGYLASHERPQGEVIAHDGPASVRRLARPDFIEDHRLRWPYATGSMTQGIGSADLVIAMARAGFLSFFGSGGLPLDVVEANLRRIAGRLDKGESWGANLINNPMHPGYEDLMVDLFFANGVHTIEASAYMVTTPGLARYRLRGARELPDGRVETPNRIVAKVSREELAEQFFSPPDAKVVDALRRAGKLTDEEARVASRVPLAQDVVGEADSAGHTDKRPAILLYPTIAELRDQVQERHRYPVRLRVGAAGGIATPQTALAAFRLGADFVLTGSINQACVESGTSALVKEMLAAALMSDVGMAPAADMFEMGVQVQVLTRGLMFHTKARKLEELFQKHASLDEIPAEVKAGLEKRTFKVPLEQVWAETRGFFEKVDPRMVEKAEQSPKVKMGLVFRWYLGLSSKWPKEPDVSRKVDFQIWCGPAMGAFNRWARGSYLEDPAKRSAPDVGRQLMHGALYLDRVQALYREGAPLPAELMRARPRPGLSDG